MVLRRAHSLPGSVDVRSRDILPVMKTVLPLVLALIAAACADTSPQETTTSTAVAAPSTSSQETTTISLVPGTSGDSMEVPVIPGPLVGIDLGIAQLDGQELLVAIADTPKLRGRGLMNVSDLLDLDGMLFVFDRDSSTRFWMRDTLIPLDIAFFDVAGTFVDGFVMEPCTTANCPTYRPNGSYRYALEMAEGDMPEDPLVLRLPAIGLGEAGEG